MPQVADWAGDSSRLRIFPDYSERYYKAGVRTRFLVECAAHNYDVRPSLRYKHGLQAWRGDTLVGEYYPNSVEAWVRK